MGGEAVGGGGGCDGVATNVTQHELIGGCGEVVGQQSSALDDRWPLQE